jgi:hypothetical protein
MAVDCSGTLRLADVPALIDSARLGLQQPRCGRAACLPTLIERVMKTATPARGILHANPQSRPMRQGGQAEYSAGR